MRLFRIPQRKHNQQRDEYPGDEAVPAFAHAVAQERTQEGEKSSQHILAFPSPPTPPPPPRRVVAGGGGGWGVRVKVPPETPAPRSPNLLSPSIFASFLPRW